jgi:hypothetical protein
MKTGLRDDERSWILSADPWSMTLPAGRFEQVADRCAAKGLALRGAQGYQLTHEGFCAWEILCDWKRREPDWFVLGHCRLERRNQGPHRSEDFRTGPPALRLDAAIAREAWSAMPHRASGGAGSPAAALALQSRTEGATAQPPAVFQAPRG